MYTRCPQCHTTFRLTATQLKAAQGMVRCGHCQAVFQAMDSLFDRPEPRHDSTETQVNVDALSRLSEPAAAKPAPVVKPSVVKPSVAPPVEPSPTLTTQSDAVALPGQLETLSALFAEQAQSAASHQATAAQPEPASVVTTAPADTPVEPLVSPWPHSRSAETRAAAELPAEEPPADYPESEPVVADSRHAPHDSSFSASPSAEPTVGTDVAPDLGAASQTSEPLATSPSESTTDAFRAALREAQQQAATLAEAANKPMPYAIPERPGWKPVLALAAWLIGSIALLLLLLLQYAYFNRDTLAQNPMLRPALAAMCQQAGCSLPLREDISKFELRDRKVESHPSASDGLMITAQIVNRADFIQPYPELEITFKNLQDKLIVKRRFLPQEYLQGMDISRGFPANQYVSIVLEIVDPGPTAINYYFDFKPGKQPLAKK